MFTTCCLLIPTDFLTALERQRYQTLPADLREEDLQASCWLTPADQQLVAQQRRGSNRLGFAIQLGVPRLLGYLSPEWYRQVPDSLVQFVAQQLELDPALFQAYGEREATLTEHLRVLLSHLQVCRWQPVLDAPWLEAWLLERALEHDNERLLLTLALGHLRQHGILRPGIVELERLVGALAERAQAETYRRLVLQLTPEVATQLDALLAVDPALGLCRHTWLHHPPTSSSATSIQQTLGKLAYLDQLGVPGWQADDLHPNRQKRLAHTARNKTNQVLQRFTPAKRQPLLVAACREAYRNLTDVVLKMVDEHWEHAVSRARRALQETPAGVCAGQIPGIAHTWAGRGPGHGRGARAGRGVAGTDLRPSAPRAAASRAHRRGRLRPPGPPLVSGLPTARNFSPQHATR